MEEMNNETLQKNKITRCAIYTRKSTEEGLEQEFNSLDAQRESAEAYITSQKSQGWTCISEHYDDGGFTGGNMDRPALQHLLADIERGTVDCVVVYKVDRLSRSLMDFAKILERFEAKGVSFVSVTQLFNSATSMGRLTLNILLSFAQFERELVSERTRDKIVLARKKGKYTGGRPVLGYDLSPEGGKLIVNETEAQQVRTIFELYLRHHGVLPVVDQLTHLGWQTKSWVTRKGQSHSGRAFNKGSVHALLSNPLYIGKVRYKDQTYEGEHDAIISETLFGQVQQLLRTNRNEPLITKPNKHGGILKGILRCKACGCGMSHSFSKKGNKRYRYYVCQNAISTGWKNCPHPSLPADEDEIERFVINEIRTIGLNEELIAEVVANSRKSSMEEIVTHREQLKLLQKELDNDTRQLKSLQAMPKTDDLQVASLREKIAMIEQDKTTTASRLTELESTTLTDDDVRTACRQFGPLWDTLSMFDQWRMLTLLLESVEFDAETESINITFAPGGVKTITRESSENLQEDALA
jgi:site-specific DNA recombinase